MRKTIKIIIFLPFLFFACGKINSQNNKDKVLEQCQLEFGKMGGIKDFELGEGYAEISKRYDLDMLGKTDSEIISYSFSEMKSILGERRKVKYQFDFKNNELISYGFYIDIGQNLNLFLGFVEEIKNKKLNTDFIYHKDTSIFRYVSDSEDCHKFLKTKQGKKGFYIVGGLSKF